MASNNLFFLLCIALVCTNIYADEGEATGKRVIVLIENQEIQTTHSIFFKSLEERGYTLKFASPNDRNARLRKFGEWLYDNVIIFAPSLEETELFQEQEIIDFIDDGRNVLVAADSNIGSFVANIASECNIEFDEAGTSVVDHFNFDVSDSDGKHDLIVAENVVDSPIILGGKSLDAPVLFRGIAQDIDEDSSLLFPILSGYSSSFSSNPEAKANTQPFVAGSKTVLVSALQARNNARVVFSGSLELFSDKFFNSPVQRYSANGDSKKYEKSGNENFAKQLVRWTFQERGILRVKSVSHHRVGETSAPSVYVIKDEVEYTIEIEEYKGKKWVPFDAKDVQLEFVRLDPHVRTYLKSDGNGKFTTTFKVPDVYGIFTFKVEYHRKGYGYLDSIERIPVRPFRHNEYERFIFSAYPYYVSAFSMMAGLFVFSWFFLFTREKTVTK